ncbi:MAG: helix-turn-helix transcriptional regulator [Planctomycetes bacterium]|nr:helix-turn-helix transcriptional regulator [Planctomycetota bacterium]
MLHILDILAVREAVARQPKRRREICEMLMEGYSRAEIAGRLGIAEMTVHTHIRRIRRSFIKMGFEPAPRRREPRSPGTGPREKDFSRVYQF